MLQDTKCCYGEVKNSELDFSVANKLVPCFAYDYQPFSTRADGNCLYNMISICLLGNDSLSMILKVLTVNNLFKNKSCFFGAPWK